MSFSKQLFILFFYLLLHIQSIAQSFEYEVFSQSIADNREYNDWPAANSQTIFGSRIAATLGTTLDSLHTFRAGIDYFYEFGSPVYKAIPKPILYYHIDHKPFRFFAGVVPRRLLFDYPRALVEDTVNYYHPNMGGLFLEVYKKGVVHQNAWIDWTGHKSLTIREAFLAGTSGRIKKDMFFIENYALLYHLADDLIDTLPIIDNAAAILWAGVDMTEFVFLDSLSVKSGFLGSLYRNRGVGYWQKNASWLSQLYLSFKGFGLKATYHYGNAHVFAWGERFYQAKNYLRADLFFTPLNFKNVRGYFRWSFHLAEGMFDQSQSFVLSVFWGNNQHVTKGKFRQLY